MTNAIVRSVASSHSLVAGVDSSTQSLQISSSATPKWCGRARPGPPPAGSRPRRVVGGVGQAGASGILEGVGRAVAVGGQQHGMVTLDAGRGRGPTGSAVERHPLGARGWLTSSRGSADRAWAELGHRAGGHDHRDQTALARGTSRTTSPDADLRAAARLDDDPLRRGGGFNEVDDRPGMRRGPSFTGRRSPRATGPTSWVGGGSRARRPDRAGAGMPPRAGPRQGMLVGPGPRTIWGRRWGSDSARRRRSSRWGSNGTVFATTAIRWRTRVVPCSRSPMPRGLPPVAMHAQRGAG